MARRSNRADLNNLIQKLQQSLMDLPANLAEGSLTSQVRSLVPLHHCLRDIGSSLPSLRIENNARARILTYLKHNVGHVVSGDELMVVSGISEYGRRARELRVENGWQILTGNTVKDIYDDPEALEERRDSLKLKPDEYILVNAEQDVDAAQRWYLAKTIRNKRLAVKDKILEYMRQNVNKPISGEELKYIAKNKSEWARRVRELRTEYGWPVVTKATGRPDLTIGIYLLEEDRQAPEHDRKIKDDVRGQVLRRDGYSCTRCSWSRQIWNPDDPRHLELHHKIMHVKGGSNEANNLITLCNTCHDAVHREAGVQG